MNQIDQAVGEKIAERRVVIRMSARALAGALDVSPERLLDMEAGRVRVSAVQLMTVSKLLNVPMTYFFADVAS